MQPGTYSILSLMLESRRTNKMCMYLSEKKHRRVETSETGHIQDDVGSEGKAKG